MSETLNLPWITVGYQTPTGSPTKSRKERLNCWGWPIFSWGSSHLFHTFFFLFSFYRVTWQVIFSPPGRWGCGHDQFWGGDPSYPAGWGGRNWTWRQRKQRVLKILALVDDGWWLLMLKRTFSLSFFNVLGGWRMTLIHVVSLPSIQVIVGRENFHRKGRRCEIGAEGGWNVSCLGHLNQNYSQWRVGILCETYLSIQHIISYYYIYSTARYLLYTWWNSCEHLWTKVNYPIHCYLLPI